jgi:hypothetical protein
MRFEGNFRRMGQIDVSALQACVTRQTEEDWTAESSRQAKFEVHRQTHTIFLLFDQDFRHVEPTWLPKGKEFADALKPLMVSISAHFGYQGWAVRCIVTRLRAGARIGVHADSGFSLNHAHRCHLPIFTNDQVAFSVGDDTINMKVGEVWEINNQRRHAVSNQGPEDRVHLILDWAEPMTHAQIRAYRADRQEHFRKVQLGLQPQYD